MALVLTQQRARQCLCSYKQVSKFKFSITKVLEGSNLCFQVPLEIFSSNFAFETPQPFRRPVFFFCFFFSCNPSHSVIGEATLTRHDFY